ncbi:TolC family protein [Robbsia sp. Bb-Pol-6]|uniref:Protein CyaE n=1 Tax=Robbsia betulipollinis TaxID=2981849 RepID=A0ABT3ZS35_9BURK|nr:TolC family protein [Robbsia betulipollinis]MCY0389292.1 TolC family protein [Robbsia betulipollinis]
MTGVRPLAWLVAAMVGVAGSAHAQMLDVLRTHGEVAVSPAAPLVRDASCAVTDETRPIELEDAILMAVCANPRARQAWADARAQAAALGQADAAFLPTLNTTAGVERDTLATTYGTSVFNAQPIEQTQNSSSRYAILNLSWVLFDFGKRGAAQRQARALLSAENAAQDEVLQTVFFDATRTFYGLRDAQASLAAARRTEVIAQESLAEAGAKHAAGAGTLADELQARTSYRRALLDRVDAEGAERDATGALAVALGLNANAPLRIASPAVDANVGGEPGLFDTGINQLIAEAEARRPSLLAARARLNAARANVDAMRAQGRPTISLVGSFTQNNPSYQRQPQEIPVTSSRGSTLGIQVTIPLFEGFALGYRIEQAQAQADSQEAAMHDAELQVSLEVWRGYNGVQTDADNLANSRDLLDDAQQALDVARGRYKEGVGTFTELLNVQMVLADAQRQRVSALSKWRAARLALARSLGKLGVWRPEP